MPSKEDFKFTQPFVHPTLMFRREALNVVGGYSEKKEQILCEDYDLLLRLYEKGLIGYNIQKELLEYTLPPFGKSSRRYKHRINETRTRYRRFKALGMLPRAFPYVVKPLIVGLMPKMLIEIIKQRG
jgi:hypothetical protein